MIRHDVVEPFPKGVHAAISTSMEEADAACGGIHHDGCQHGNHRSGTDTAAHQNNRRSLGTVQDKIAIWSAHLDVPSSMQFVMQQVGNSAGRFCGVIVARGLALHGNAQPFPVRCIRETVLARLFEIEFADKALDAYELARFERREILSVRGHEIER
ncbi:hypothetical protein AWB68_08954 [Caballeronia choica]|uniref:Uncharacterized protein n=1 Tax=Caballeronia choica TaxID=326476 RepID=A0A158L755_9BURK|nr:hypothetical protein AWB68_08954 [Caballeronia choica]